MISKKIFQPINIIVTIIFITSISLAEESKDFFSGGMAFHIGYGEVENSEGEFDGPAFGLGGLLHFYYLDVFRFGACGASSWMNYSTNGPNGSYMRLGYGGVTVEFSKPVKEWRFSGGILLGGGAFNNLHLVSKDANGVLTSLYQDKGTFIFSPLLSAERNINESLKGFIMMDFLIGPNISDKNHFGGPKLLLGILFRK